MLATSAGTGLGSESDSWDPVAAPLYASWSLPNKVLFSVLFVSPASEDGSKFFPHKAFSGLNEMIHIKYLV